MSFAILPLSRRRIRSVIYMAATMMVVPMPDVDEETRRARAVQSGLVGLVGHWTESTSGGAGVVVDGEKWSGQTAQADLRKAVTSLFGSADSTLLAHWTTPTAFPVAVVTNVREFSAGTLRVQFNMLGGKSDQNAGVMFGLRPNGEYLYVRYNTKDGNVALWKFSNGERSLVKGGEVHKQLPMGKWHELVVTIRGNVVHGAIAGDTTISVTHTLDAAPSGRIGLWVKRDAITGFQSFRAQTAASR